MFLHLTGDIKRTTSKRQTTKKMQSIASEDVWVNGIIPFCNFSTIQSILLVDKSFHPSLYNNKNYWMNYIHHKYVQLHTQVLNELAIESPVLYVTDAFQKNIWNEEYNGSRSESDPTIYDWKRITMNHFIYICTDPKLEDASLQDFFHEKMTRRELSHLLRQGYFSAMLSPLMLLLKLVERYFPEWCSEDVDISDSDLVQVRHCIEDLLEQWTLDIVSEFKCHYKNYRDLILDFFQPIIVYLKIVNPMLGSAIQHVLVEQWSILHKQQNNQSNTNTFVNNKMLIDKPIKEIIKVFTVRDAVTKANITPVQLNGQSWHIKKREERSPGVLVWIQHFNYLSKWVVDCILNLANLSQRTQCLEKMMKIAIELLKNNNISSCQAIMSGLNTAAIHRLVHTWEGVNKKIKEEYNGVSQVLSSNNGYREIRNRCKADNPELIPYLGLYLNDLVFAGEGNQTSYSQGKYCHTKRLVIVSQIISEFLRHRKHPILTTLSSEEINRCLELFETNCVTSDFTLDDADEFKRSLELEPRGSTFKKKSNCAQQ
jgi:hypothetical protein